MAKHATEILDLHSIINLIGAHARDSQWYDVMELDTPGLDEANENGESDGWEKASKIEADYIAAHQNDQYEVSWPEHVTVARFNGDASYCLVETNE